MSTHEQRHDPILSTTLAVRARLARPGGWIRGEPGGSAGPNCLVGAIIFETVPSIVREDMMHFLAGVIGPIPGPYHNLGNRSTSRIAHFNELDRAIAARQPPLPIAHGAGDGASWASPYGAWAKIQALGARALA